MDCTTKRLTRDVKGQITGGKAQSRHATDRANDRHHVTLFAGNSATCVKSVIVNS